MGDFSFLGHDKLRAAIVARDAADAALAAGDEVEAIYQLRALDRAMTDDEGEQPDDGAIDQFGSVLEALQGDEVEEAFLRECAADDGVDVSTRAAFLAYAADYALEDLRGRFEYAIAHGF